jgi:hypothetical protein
MTAARAILPNRRHAERLTFYHDGAQFQGTLGFANLEAALPSEVFLDGGKPGSSLNALCRDFAVVVSIALQYGTPLETMRQAVTRLNDDGLAAGPGGMLLDLIVMQKANRNG